VHLLELAQQLAERPLQVVGHLGMDGQRDLVAGLRLRRIEQPARISRQIVGSGLDPPGPVTVGALRFRVLSRLGRVRFRVSWTSRCRSSQQLGARGVGRELSSRAR